MQLELFNQNEELFKKGTNPYRVYQYLRKNGTATVRELFNELFINAPEKAIQIIRDTLLENNIDEIIDDEWIKTENSRYKRYIWKKKFA